MENQTLSNQDVILNIKKTRKSKEYSQDYLALKLNISQNAYSKIEIHQSKLTMERLFKIAIILNVDVMDLFKAEAPISDAPKVDVPGVNKQSAGWYHFDRR